MNRFETRGVLAGAYRGGRASLKVTLSHSVEVNAEGGDVRVLCGRVPLDSMADPFAGVDLNEAPTCVICARRLARA